MSELIDDIERLKLTPLHDGQNIMVDVTNAMLSQAIERIAAHQSKQQEALTKGQIMADALRTIASGKKDYGVSIADKDYSECRSIARKALIGVGLISHEEGRG